MSHSFALFSLQTCLTHDASAHASRVLDSQFTCEECRCGLSPESAASCVRKADFDLRSLQNLITFIYLDKPKNEKFWLSSVDEMEDTEHVYEA